MRDAILAVLLTIAVFALIREIRSVNDLLVVGVCLFMLPMGAWLALVRKNVLRSQVAAELHALTAVFTEEYNTCLSALLAEETGEGPSARRGSFRGRDDYEESDSTESVADGGTEGGRAIVPVPSPAARSADLIPLGTSAITRHSSRARTPSVISRTVGNRRVLGVAAGENEQPKTAMEIVSERMSSYRLTRLRSSVIWETDLELVLRIFRDEWFLYSSKEKPMARAVMTETILAILQSTNFSGYTYMWLALVNRYFFDETFLCYKYIKLSHSQTSKWHLDINYILYQLQKDIETARQMEFLGAGGKKTNLIDIMTYQKWSRAAKLNHMQALKKMSRFWRALAAEGKTATAKPSKAR